MTVKTKPDTAIKTSKKESFDKFFDQFNDSAVMEKFDSMFEENAQPELRHNELFQSAFIDVIQEAYINGFETAKKLLML